MAMASHANALVRRACLEGVPLYARMDAASRTRGRVSEEDTAAASCWFRDSNDGMEGSGRRWVGDYAAGMSAT